MTFVEDLVKDSLHICNRKLRITNRFKLADDASHGRFAYAEMEVGAVALMDCSECKIKIKH